MESKKMSVQLDNFTGKEAEMIIKMLGVLELDWLEYEYFSTHRKNENPTFHFHFHSQDLPTFIRLFFGLGRDCETIDSKMMSFEELYGRPSEGSD